VTGGARKKLVIKAGGALLDSAETRGRLAAEFVEITREWKLAVVHGGGKQVTQFLERQGIESRFVRGLRVSDEPVIDAVLQIIAGRVNKRLVASILAAGGAAVGISGVDAALTIASRMDEAMGWVGRAERTDGRLFDALTDAGYLPVTACVAGDLAGNIYNVNADQMAVSCALGWGAERLLFLTDVAGVKGGGGSVLHEIRPEQAGRLIEAGIVRGGMQAKLEAAFAALRAGMAEVIVAPGEEPGVCRRILEGETLGTRLSGTARERSVTV